MLGGPRQGCEGNSFAAGMAVVYACELKQEQLNPSKTLRQALSARRSHTSPGYSMYREYPDRPFDLDALPLPDAIKHVRQVVRDWVVPWALDEGDPVREPLRRLFADYPAAAGVATSF